MAFEILNQILDPVLKPLLTLVNDPTNPMFGAIVGVFLIATIVAFIITLANKLMVDQDRLQFLQKEMKEYQQEMMKAQKSGDTKEMEKVKKRQSEFMELQKEMMFNSFKPMIVTFVPIIIIFYWMAQSPVITQFYVQLPTVAYYVLLVPLFHMFYHPSSFVPANILAIEWLGWYILSSFAMSLIFRKLMGLKGAM